MLKVFEEAFGDVFMVSLNEVKDYDKDNNCSINLCIYAQKSL